MTATLLISTPADHRPSGKQVFAALVENATDMIVQYDARLCYVYCNPAVAQPLGDRAQTYLGKPPLEVEGRPREQAECIDQSLRQVLETGRKLQVEQSYPVPAGQKYCPPRSVSESSGPGGRVISLSIPQAATGRSTVDEVPPPHEINGRQIGRAHV
jgi:PAS domain-containing protein